VGEEALAPGLERLGIVQAQDLDIGDEKPGALDRRPPRRVRMPGTYFAI
jgi:hypothetical protein